MMRINTRPSSEQPGTDDRENQPTPPNGSERGNPFDQNNKGMPNMEISNSGSNSNIWIYLSISILLLLVGLLIAKLYKH